VVMVGPVWLWLDLCGYAVDLCGYGWTCVATVGQSHICTPCMTVYLVVSLFKIPYIPASYIYGSGPPYV